MGSASCVTAAWDACMSCDWCDPSFATEDETWPQLKHNQAFPQRKMWKYETSPAVQPLELLCDKLLETSLFRHAFSCSDTVLLEELSLGSEPMLCGPFSVFVLKNNEGFISFLRFKMHVGICILNNHLTHLVFLWQLLYGAVFNKAWCVSFRVCASKGAEQEGS